MKSNIIIMGLVAQINAASDQASKVSLTKKLIAECDKLQDFSDELLQQISAALQPATAAAPAPTASGIVMADLLADLQREKDYTRRADLFRSIMSLRSRAASAAS